MRSPFSILPRGPRLGPWAAVAVVLTASVAAAQGPPAPPKDATALFDSTKVWAVHLTFSADQWKAIEPRRNAGPGGPFGPGPNSNRNAARAAELLAAVVMSQGDADRDGRLTADEFAALGKKWSGPGIRAGRAGSASPSSGPGSTPSRPRSAAAFR